MRMADSSSASLAGEAGELQSLLLGASNNTVPWLLRRLARQGPVTVRVVVAMNRAVPADTNQLLAGDSDERVRALLAGKLAGLDPVVTNRQDLDSLIVLAADPSIPVRAAVADALKQRPNAPRWLILQLARDPAVTISDPVIRLSPVLTQADLLSLLARPPSGTTRVSVARRPHLTIAISDAIVASGDKRAIGALLSNPSSVISDRILDGLASQRTTDAAIALAASRRLALHRAPPNPNEFIPALLRPDRPVPARPDRTMPVVPITGG